MMDATRVADMGELRMEKGPGSVGVSWGRFGGILMLMAGTLSF